MDFRNSILEGLPRGCRNRCNYLLGQMNLDFIRQLIKQLVDQFIGGD